MPKPGPRTRQALWNVKLQKPELFNVQDRQLKEKHASEETPLGFENCADRDGWLYHPGRRLYLEKTTGRLCWLDAASAELRPLHQGEPQALTFLGGAASRLGAGTDVAPPTKPQQTNAVASAVSANLLAGTAVTAIATAPAAPKHVVVPDLHRAGQAMKVELDHLDRPASMLAVFGVVGGDANAILHGQAVPSSASVRPETAARLFHERLIKQLAAYRGAWSGDRLLEALVTALQESGGPTIAVALVVGRCVVVSASPGTRVYLVSEPEESGSAEAVVADVVAEFTPGLGEAGKTDMRTLTESSAPLAVVLAAGAGPSLPDGSAVADACALHLWRGRPRAASVALLRSLASSATSCSACAVAAARLICANAGALAACERERAAKRLKRDDEAAPPSKVRVRQILLRHSRSQAPGAGVAQAPTRPTDPVRKKLVTRSPEEAELQLLQVLDELLAADSFVGFSSICKALSECQSSLKGGELAGDLGWLDRVKGTADEHRSKVQPVKTAVPANVHKAAFELDVGELSDLILSDVGVHLLLRTG